MQKIFMEKRELPYEIDEEIKTLRTNLMFSGADKKVIMITSCISSEGKTTQSFRLACSLAELGKRVLLVDGDLRRSELKHQIAEGEISHGLSHYLSGQCSVSEILCETNIMGLYIVFAGIVPPNPSELLSSKLFSDMIQQARDRFDYIIIDTPPLGMVVDAAVIAPVCDGSILAIQSGEIRHRMAQDVTAMLRNTGTPILGAVLTQMGKNKNGREYGSYYGRYYGRKYGGYYKYGKQYNKYTS